MRINQWLAQHTSYSRRSSDELVAAGRVTVNGHPAQPGQQVQESDTIQLDGKMVADIQTMSGRVVLLHKPVGFVCSRRGQGAPSVYVLLPTDLQTLNIAGRLDKDSSGLLVFTDDGDLLYDLTHPSKQVAKSYQATLDKPLSAADQVTIAQKGVPLDDGISRFSVTAASSAANTYKAPLNIVRVTMHEGRNRQIRRTFEALGYRVTSLVRLQHGPYNLGSLKPRQHMIMAAKSPDKD